MPRAVAHSRFSTSLGVLVVLALAGCGNSTGGDPDGGAEAGDMVLPPDTPRGDSWTGHENIGAPCDPAKMDSDCKGKAVCLDVHSGTSASCDIKTGMGCGICVTTGCTPEDISKSGKEDDCPEVTLTGRKVKTICTRISVMGGDGGAASAQICLPSCTPSAVKNPCQSYGHAGVACDPMSIALNNQTDVCLNPTCIQDHDCGNKDPFKPDAICNKKNGLCFPRGSASGDIGKACTSSSDCGKYQTCFQEQKDSKGATVFEEGYCSLVGCTHFVDAATTPYWECPQNSKCKLLTSNMSVCMAYGCDFAKPVGSDGCRDTATDGQYDCIQDDVTKGVCWIDLSPTKK